MLSDIVVDTNVWVHASNPSDGNFGASQAFLIALRASKTRLCVDRWVRNDAASADSLILAEYAAQRLPFGSLAADVLARLAQTNRLSAVSLRPPVGTRAQIRRRVANARDRTFLEVAFCSEDRTLTSHDWDHFSESTRSWMRAALLTMIIEATEATALVTRRDD